MIVQTDAVTTVRIAAEDVTSRRMGNASLMPSRFLRDLSDGDIADLDQHLQTLAMPIAKTPH